MTRLCFEEFLELGHEQRVNMIVEKYKNRPWVFANDLDDIEAKTILMQVVDISLNETELTKEQRAKRLDDLIDKAINDMAVKAASYDLTK